MSISYLAIPSAVALLIKCCFLVYVYLKRKKFINQLLITSLIVVFCVLNIIEFISFTDYPFTVELIKYYYLTCIIGLILITHLVTVVTNVKINALHVLHGYGLAIMIPFMFTDLFIVDVVRLHHTYTGVPGECYFLFEFFAVSELLVSLYLVCRSTFSLKENKHIIRARSSVLLISLLPLIISALLIILLMALGYKINSVIIFPIVTTIFLFGCVYACTDNKILDLSLLIPGTPSWKRKNDLLFFLYAENSNIDLQNSLLKLERMYIMDAISQHDGKISKAAMALGYSPGKLDYRLKSVHQLDKDSTKSDQT